MVTLLDGLRGSISDLYLHFEQGAMACPFTQTQVGYVATDCMEGRSKLGRNSRTQPHEVMGITCGIICGYFNYPSGAAVTYSRHGREGKQETNEYDVVWNGNRMLLVRDPWGACTCRGNTTRKRDLM